jgi:hypothetical protein
MIFYAFPLLSRDDERDATDVSASSVVMSDDQCRTVM